MRNEKIVIMFQKIFLLAVVIVLTLVCSSCQKRGTASFQVLDILHDDHMEEEIAVKTLSLNKSVKVSLEEFKNGKWTEIVSQTVDEEDVSGIHIFSYPKSGKIGTETKNGRKFSSAKKKDFKKIAGCSHDALTTKGIHTTVGTEKYCLALYHINPPTESDKEFQDRYSENKTEGLFALTISALK